jgi:hypothetical protein
VKKRETRAEERAILREAIRVLRKSYYSTGYDMTAPCAICDIEDIIETETLGKKKK